jgi:hypothetical protein
MSAAACEAQLALFREIGMFVSCLQEGMVAMHVDID